MIPTKEEWYSALRERHGKEFQERVSSATVAICGLGGLGSSVATALTRAGIGKLILIDFDRVDISNLHRQQFKACQIGMFKTDALSINLKEISPYVDLEAETVRITEENALDVLKEADVICEAFDDAECKAELVNLVLEKLSDKYLVAASGMAGLGSGNSIHTRRITSKFYLCGDENSGVDEVGSLISSRVMICAAHQANTILRILANEFET